MLLLHPVVASLKSFPELENLEYSRMIESFHSESVLQHFNHYLKANILEYSGTLKLNKHKTECRHEVRTIPFI